MVWTIPKEYNHTNVVNTAPLNKYLADNINYLVARPSNILTRVLTNDITVNSGVPVLVSPSLSVGLTTTHECDLLYSAIFAVQEGNETTSPTIVFDVLWGDIYLSSLTDTNLDYGCAVAGENLGLNVERHISIDVVIPKVSVGSHYFNLVGWSTTGSSVTFLSNSFHQFSLKEI